MRRSGQTSTAIGLMLAAILAPCSLAQPPTDPAPHPPRLLDGFKDPSSWKPITSDGVSLKLIEAPGRTGKSLRLDYDFSRGSGYAIIRKPFDLPLPENYRFSYHIRGSGPRNTVEFKLIDPSGENVWWVNTRNFEFPEEWTPISLPKRKIGFAWGPAGAAKPLAAVGFIEIVVTSFNGGRGSVWLDDLEFEPLPAVRTSTGIPTFRGSSPSAGMTAARPIERDGTIAWTSAATDDHPTAWIDFGQARDLGGMVISWGGGGDRHATDYDVLCSVDGERFVEAARVRGSNGGRDYVQLPDATARAVEIRVLRAAGDKGVTIDALRFMNPEFGDSANEMLRVVGADAPRGRWPRYLRGEAAYWTVVGADADDKEALVGEDGAVEVDKLAFSLEPFVYENGELRTWNDGETAHTLEDGFLPIPSVTRSDRGLVLKTTTFAAGEAGASTLIVRYELRNADTTPRAGKLFVAIRPMQVNPPYQNLNITGGAAVVRRVHLDAAGIGVDDRLVVPLTRPDAFGATSFDGGEIVEHLALGRVPNADHADDPRGLCSGALQYGFDLQPGETRAVAVLVPFHGHIPPAGAIASIERSPAFADSALTRTRDWWRERLGRVTIQLPHDRQHIVDSVRANLAYILVNRDGAGLQPGSRCYDRTWIRDGALTSSALLAMGLSDEVREFLDWFAPFQYDNGKIPCCVDARGPDPVPEHDSHGEYITAVQTYFAFTRDREFLARHWPRVLKAAGYIEFLRDQRMTDEYADGPDEKRVLHGLMPESISHEGYSAKPMHSYWDDFWTLRGLRDAARIAEEIGLPEQAARLTTLGASFSRTLNDSIRLTGKLRAIDFVPGCAELGDFDATSTTVALFPCAWEPGDLRPMLDRTFDRYWSFFKNRRDGTLPWKDYTPYEQRIVGSMVLLGRRDRALEMLDFFFKDQRPRGWASWAEVVRRDPREQGYIGDMPHTWVGSDFINSVRLMLAYTRDADAALVIGAGLPRAWLEASDGVRVRGLRTECGPLSFSAAGIAGGVRFDIAPLEHPPAGGVWIDLPQPDRLQSVSIGGVRVTLPKDGLVRLQALPATLDVRYRGAGE